MSDDEAAALLPEIPDPIPPPVRQLLSMAARTLRAYPTRVLVPALIVFAFDALVATTLTEVSADHHGLESVGAAVIGASSSLGLLFYSGLLERLIGAVERGLPAPPTHEVMRSLPYLRLLRADALLGAAAAVASLAFVVPGLVVTTLGALVGPRLTMGGGTIREAFSTSVRLVTPNFLLVLCLITLPLALEQEAVTGVALLVHHENVVLVFATHLALGLTFGVGLGLVEVALAESLLHGARGPA